MTTKAMYAGSFDPITSGHVDVIVRAASMFDEVVIAVGINPKKPGLFTPEERIELVKAACRKFKNIRVASYTGLTAGVAREMGCRVLVRGLRDAQDFGFEMQMAHMNRHLEPTLDTIFIPTVQELSEISSSLVKEVASLGGNIEGLVPTEVAKALKGKFKKSVSSSVATPKKSRKR